LNEDLKIARDGMQKSRLSGVRARTPIMIGQPRVSMASFCFLHTATVTCVTCDLCPHDRSASCEYGELVFFAHGHYGLCPHGPVSLLPSLSQPWRDGAVFYGALISANTSACRMSSLTVWPLSCRALMVLPIRSSSTACDWNAEMINDQWTTNLHLSHMEKIIIAAYFNISSQRYCTIGF
jgi:hypothetical protein